MTPERHAQIKATIAAARIVTTEDALLSAIAEMLLDRADVEVPKSPHRLREPRLPEQT